MSKNKIALNKSINELIYKCFSYLDEEDQNKFLRKFKQYTVSSSQSLHTTRELILGAFISSICPKVKYDLKINGKTPDWCILDDNSNIKCLVELTSIHIDKVMEQKINTSLDRKEMIVVWRDEEKNNSKRLYDTVLNKIQLYKHLVINHKSPYFIALFFDFFFPLNYDEIQNILVKDNNGLFELYPELSGVIVFEEKNGSYLFKQFLNEKAVYPFTLSDGIFPIY